MVRRSRKFRQSALTGLAVAGLLALQAQLLQSTVSVTTPQSDQSSVEANYAKLPLAFEPNQGQADSSVDFLVHHGQAVTAFSGTSSTTSVGGKQVTMSLDGANSSSFTGQDELQSKTNYFLGSDQSQWHSDIPNFQKLIATNVYPGIDLAYYGTNSTLEHDFIVSPGSDYHQIAFSLSGQDELTQDKDGNLVLKAGDDQLQLNAPTTYQLGEHEKHTIPSQFELHDNTVTVAVASDYDPTKPLVIDPTLNLIYSTYLGGSGNEIDAQLAVTPSGNVVIAGQTASTNFPTASPYQASNAGSPDIYIAKFSPNGSSLIYATYVGGTASDDVDDVAVDIQGNAYVAGATASTNFPTVSAAQSTYAGGTHDAFVLKMNPSGSALTYSTFLGGSSDEVAAWMAVDSSGNGYITGQTDSNNFPTVSPFQASRAGNFDTFLTKVAANGSSFVFSTYLGGSAIDVADGIAVDSSGSAYLSGVTTSTNFPTASPYQASNAGGDDAFLVKFSPTGSSLVYSTYLGGTGNDFGKGIVVDNSGVAYAVGETASTNFPTASPYQASNAGGSFDAYIVKMNAAGSALTYSTYFGGTGSDVGFDIGIDSSNNILVTGWTDSTNLPLANAYQGSNAGGNDAFVAKFNSAGSALTYSTYLGGSGGDFGTTIGVGLNGDAFVGGQVASANFPTANAFQASLGGGNDAFVTEITEHTVNLTARVNPTLTFTVGSTACALGSLSTTQTQQCTYTLTAATNGTSGYSISYLPVATLTSGANTITALSSPTASTLNAEQFGINLAANTAAGSHTASNFGAAPSGGSGTVSANYNTANSFKLATGGETIATATSPSLTTTYTVSTIANIANTTEAGSYTTTFTYNVVSTY